MVLAQKQTHRSMEQDRQTRNKPTHLRKINLLHWWQEYTMEKRQSIKGARETGQLHVKE